MSLYSDIEKEIQEICKKVGLTPEEVEPLAQNTTLEEFSSAIDKLLKAKQETKQAVGERLYRAALTKWAKNNQELLKTHVGNLVALNAEEGILASVTVKPLVELPYKIEEMIELDSDDVTKVEELRYVLLTYPSCISTDGITFEYADEEEIWTETAEEFIALVESVRVDKSPKI